MALDSNRVDATRRKRYEICGDRQPAAWTYGD